MYIEVPLLKRVERMRKRGDNLGQILKRIINDWFVFSGAKKKADIVFNNADLAQCVAAVSTYMKGHVDNINHGAPCPYKHTVKCLHCSDGYDDDGEMYCAQEQHHTNLT